MHKTVNIMVEGEARKRLRPATGEWWEAFLEAHQEVAVQATLIHLYILLLYWQGGEMYFIVAKCSSVECSLV